MIKVLDASAIINAQAYSADNNYTVPGVIEEIKDYSSKMLVESMQASHQLKIQAASSESLDKVENKAREVGSADQLSDTDKRVIALALDLNSKVISDDFTIQNLCAHLKLEFSGVTRGEIKEKKTF